MLFERGTLISALIHSSNEENNEMIYSELLQVILRLIEQETINEKYIDEFQYCDNLSDETIKFYTQTNFLPTKRLKKAKKYDNINKKACERKLYYMCKASELAKYTINSCLEKNYEIDTPKLQKLLTIMQGRFLSIYGQPLFPEDIEVWECGVAIRKVNRDFKNYIFGIKELQECYLAILENEKNVLDSVVNEFGSMDVFEINQDSRLQRIKRAYEDKISQQPNIVPVEFIKKVFDEYV